MLEFNIDRNTLLNALQRVLPASEKKATLPILEHVLIEAEDGQIRLTCSNLETTLTTVAECETRAGGVAAVPAHKLFGIVRTLPDDSRLAFKQAAERMSLICGKSRFQLLWAAGGEFPRPEHSESFATLRVERISMARLLKKTLFACAVADVRYYLNGLQLTAADGELQATGTDGHRLARYRVEADVTTKAPVAIILPRAAAEIIQRAAGAPGMTLLINVSDRLIDINFGDLRLWSKLIDASYPDADRVIPSRLEHQITLDCAALTAGIGRVTNLANSDYKGVRLNFSPEGLALQCRNQEAEEANDILDLDTPFSGEVSVGYNARYLLDAIGAIDSETCTLQLTDGNTSALISGSEGREILVVMPMRL